MSDSSVELQRSSDTPQIISAQSRLYWQDLNLLLARIDTAATPYQVLGLEQDASDEEIWRTYVHLTGLLYPGYSVSSAFPEAMQRRIERTFARISRAFAVLANFNQRARYDQTLPSPLPPTQAIQAEAAPGAGITDTLELERVNVPDLSEFFLESVPKETPAQALSDEDPVLVPMLSAKYPRRFPRFKMRLPVTLTGYHSRGTLWQEAAQTGEVSRMGVSIRMRQRVRHGMVLQLALNLPMKLRAYSFDESEYLTYAIVRSVIPRGQGVRDVGLEFLGQHPPEGYALKPWNIFRTDSWNGVDRRRMPRVYRTESVKLEFFNDGRQLLSSGDAVTETLSLGGACVLASDFPDEFDLVGVRSDEKHFESLAVVTNRYPGYDGRERLCLQFIEQQWPV